MMLIKLLERCLLVRVQPIIAMYRSYANLIFEYKRGMFPRFFLNKCLLNLLAFGFSLYLMETGNPFCTMESLMQKVRPSLEQEDMNIGNSLSFSANPNVCPGSSPGSPVQRMLSPPGLSRQRDMFGRRTPVSPIRASSWEQDLFNATMQNTGLESGSQQLVAECWRSPLPSEYVITGPYGVLGQIMQDLWQWNVKLKSIGAVPEWGSPDLLGKNADWILTLKIQEPR